MAPCLPAGPAVRHPRAGGDGGHVLPGSPRPGTQVRQLQPSAPEPCGHAAERRRRGCGPPPPEVGCARGAWGGVRLCVSVGDCLTKQHQVALGVFAKDKSWRSLQTKVRAAVPSWSQTPAVPLPAESEELGACAPQCKRRAVRIYECVLLVHVPGGTEDAVGVARARGFWSLVCQ